MSTNRPSTVLMLDMPGITRALPVFAIALLACAGSSGPADVSDGNDQNGIDGWTLVWADEFDGSSLDSSRWTIVTGDGCDRNLCGWGNNELEWYQAANVEVAAGLLTITARQQPANGRNFTSARLNTAGKGDWTYGRIDIRARLPLGKGIWPAIWMLPTDQTYGPWAASGEIDIVELVGHEPDRVVGTLHYGGPAPANRYSGAPYILGSGTFADGFHTFSLEWERGSIRWYVDGTHYQTQTDWSTTAAPWPAPFDRRFHLILNVAVGGNWPGNPDATTRFPQSMEVDWVRVYTRAN